MSDMHRVEARQNEGNGQEFASPVNDGSEPYVAVSVSDEPGRLGAHWLSKACCSKMQRILNCFPRLQGQIIS